MYWNVIAFAGLAIGFSLVADLVFLIYRFRPDIVDWENRYLDTRSSDLDQIYDFIVIGGGSAGSVVASRLSENGTYSVLLLEAGGEEHVSSEIVCFWSELMGSELDWKFQTTPQARACLISGGVCPLPRGKVLGGSSAINGMMYVRGNRLDFDHWESLGNPGWGYDDVLPYFKKSEKTTIPHLVRNGYHGTDGYLNVEYPRYTSKLRDYIWEAAKEMNDLNVDDDYNGRDQIGVSRTQATMRDGLRCSANKAFLRPAKRRRNLKISLNSYVTKIVINPITKRARKVQFIRNGRKYCISARKEIILSAGAIQSPQILLLSGIGAREQLTRHGIRCLHDLPGVGENLQDHVGYFPAVLLTNPNSNDSLSILSKDVLTRESIKEFVFKDQGLLYSYSAELIGFSMTKYTDQKLRWPDIQTIYTSSADFVGIVSKIGENKDGFLCAPYILRPESRGKVYLGSNDPMNPPLIDPNYFSSKKDTDTAVSLI